MKREKMLSEGKFPRAKVRGSLLLASMMTVSFGILIVLGMVTTSLSEKLSTQQIVQQAKALQLAHTGVEYALWEINYSGADYTGAGWGAPDGASHTYTGIANLSVTVNDPITDTDPANDSDQITITSRGSPSTVARTIIVRVPPRGAAPPPAPGVFNQILYSNNGTLHLYAGVGGSIHLDGYNSNGSALVDPVIIRNDTRPFRKIGWATVTDPPDSEAAPIILEGNVTTTNVKLIFRTPNTAGGETPDPGYEAFIPNESGVAVKGGAGFSGTVEQNSSLTGYTFPPEVGAEYNSADINDYVDWIRPDQYLGKFNPFTEVMVICPGESLKVDQITVQDATLVMGCSLEAGAYNCEAPTTPFRDIYGDLMNSGDADLTNDGKCAGANPSGPVTLSSAQGGTVGNYALETTGTTGKIVIASPTKIYYNHRGTAGGFHIGANGIENTVRDCSTCAIKPSALKIYGGDDGIPHDSYFETSTPFHGAIFNPWATVNFNATGSLTPMEFSGSLNIQALRTGAKVNIHWDAALKTGGGGGGGGGGGTVCTPANHDCRPIAGTWSIENN